MVQPVTQMMHLSCTKSCWQPLRVMLFVCISCVFLTGADSGSGAGDSRTRFVQLDSEIQAIKEEILGINREIRLIEELSLYPHGQQLIVLVSTAPDSSLVPENISLQLDGQLASQHRYSASETTAMLKGGVHRLYTGRVREGEYRLQVSVRGKDVRGDAFNQQSSATITKRVGQKYVELHLGLRAGSGKPELVIREW